MKKLARRLVPIYIRKKDSQLNSIIVSMEGR